MRVSEEGLLIILCWDVTPSGSFGIGGGAEPQVPSYPAQMELWLVTKCSLSSL